MREDVTRVRLERAISKQQIGTVEELARTRARALLQDAQLSYPNQHLWGHNPPVHPNVWTRALMAGNEQILSTLLRYNADIKSLPAHQLAHQLFELALVLNAPGPLLERCYALAGMPDLNTLRDSLQRHPLFYALSRGANACVAWCIERGMRPSCTLSAHPNDPMRSLKGWARRLCKDESIQKLVADSQQCAQLHQRYLQRFEQQRQHLVQALQERNPTMVYNLMSSGARFGWQMDDLMAVGGSNASAHEQAQSLLCDLIAQNELQIIDTLLLHSSLTRGELMLCALHCGGSKEVFDLACAGFAETHAVLPGGNTWLHEAVLARNPGAVQALLDSGADARLLGNTQEDVLTLAARQGSPEIMEMLLRHTGAAVVNLSAGDFDVHIMEATPADPEPVDLTAPTTVQLFPKSLLDAVKKRASEQDAEVRAQMSALHGRMSAHNGQRQLISACHSERVRALTETFATFEEVIHDIADQVMMLELAAQKLSTAVPLKLPNILLVGGAGIGKTHFCNALAQALGLPMQRLDMASITAVFVLTGNAPTWRSAQAGKIVEHLAAGTCANSLILLDELDKMGARSDGASYPVEGALFSLLEPSQCAQWTDEFIDLPVNAGHLNFIASANDLSALHPAIASRFSIYRIEQPTQEQAVKTLRSIYARALENHPWGVLFDSEPSAEVLDALWTLSARTAQQVLLKGFVRAAREGRTTVLAHDLTVPMSKKPSIGFT